MEKRKEKENKVKGREKLVQCQINQMRGLEKGAITDIKSQPTSNKVTTLSNPYWCKYKRAGCRQKGHVGSKTLHQQNQKA